MSSKQQIIQVYLHFREYLSPMKSYTLLKSEIDNNCPFNCEQLEQVRISKLAHSKPYSPHRSAGSNNFFAKVRELING